MFPEPRHGTSDACLLLLTYVIGRSLCFAGAPVCPDKELPPCDGKSVLGMSLDPYIFVPWHLFALIHETSHSNSFYLILLISSYDTISDKTAQLYRVSDGDAV